MSWERDPLWTKARLFFEHALDHDRDDPRFGLWCAFGLELLARAAIASVSPTLLAQSDREHRHLLHALGRGDPKLGPQSISASEVFRLCSTLFDQFGAEHTTSALALVNRRNTELHSGESAFAGYTTQHWIPGLYSCCRALVEPLGETLATLLGKDEAAEAAAVLAVMEKEVRERVLNRIARYGEVFNNKPEAERSAAQVAAEAAAQRLAHNRHHRVRCPACSSVATVQGDTLGSSKVEHDAIGAEIVVKQAVAPRRFSCTACNLTLEGYAELAVARVGDQYTRTTRYSPEEYYELINPDDHEEIARIARDHLGFYDPRDEYDNE